MRFVSSDQNKMNILALTLTCDRVLMDNFTPTPYDQFEVYKRHALPKQAVRTPQSVPLAMLSCSSHEEY